jgi:hypothetical protein
MGGQARTVGRPKEWSREPHIQRRPRSPSRRPGASPPGWPPCRASRGGEGTRVAWGTRRSAGARARSARRPLRPNGSHAIRARRALAVKEWGLAGARPHSPPRRRRDARERRPTATATERERTPRHPCYADELRGTTRSAPGTFNPSQGPTWKPSRSATSSATSTR